MIIAVDFDGTVVTHDYPDMGKDIGAVPVLKWLTDEGHKLILWTMRSGQELHEAEGWFEAHNIPLFGVNENPMQLTWTKSPKAYANIYIDDAALGCPVKEDRSLSSRPFVDWKRIENYLKSVFAGSMTIGFTDLISVSQ